MRKHTAAEMGKSGQIWDTKPKTGQMGVPGELWFFPEHVIKIGTVMENPGRMVTLMYMYISGKKYHQQGWRLKQEITLQLVFKYCINKICLCCCSVWA